MNAFRILWFASRIPLKWALLNIEGLSSLWYTCLCKNLTILFFASKQIRGKPKAQGSNRLSPIGYGGVNQRISSLGWVINMITHFFIPKFNNLFQRVKANWAKAWSARFKPPKSHWILEDWIRGLVHWGGWSITVTHFFFRKKLSPNFIVSARQHCFNRNQIEAIIRNAFHGREGFMW